MTFLGPCAVEIRGSCHDVERLVLVPLLRQHLRELQLHEREGPDLPVGKRERVRGERAAWGRAAGGICRARTGRGSRRSMHRVALMSQSRDSSYAPKIFCTLTVAGVGPGRRERDVDETTRVSKGLLVKGPGIEGGRAGRHGTVPGHGEEQIGAQIGAR